MAKRKQKQKKELKNDSDRKTRKKKDPVQEALLLEAHRINYRLRSTFFLQKLREYDTLGMIPTIAELAKVADAYCWDERNSWSIDATAFDFITKSAIEPLQVFCHPKLIREHPRLIAYYRNVAALSQKSVKYLVSLDVKRWELKSEAAVSELEALRLACLCNDHVSLIVNSSVRSLEPAHVTGLLFASTGAQIDGSWRNAIGEEAEKVVQRLLVKEAIDRDILVALIRRTDGNHESLYENGNSSSDFDITKFKGFLLKNQTSVLFSSEPDVSLLDMNGSTVAVLEVKGGTDPAGALERYGAAKKSFEATLSENAKVQTLLIASCLTPEVLARVKRDKTISHYFNLTQLLSDEVFLKKCMDCVFSQLGA